MFEWSDIMISITAITFIILFIRCRKKKNELLKENEELKAEIARLNQTIMELQNKPQEN